MHPQRDPSYHSHDLTGPALIALITSLSCAPLEMGLICGRFHPLSPWVNDRSARRLTRCLFMPVLFLILIALDAPVASAQIIFAPPVRYDVNTPSNQQYPASTIWQGMTSADLNGDGHTDVAINTIEGVAVLRNNGDGTLASPVKYALRDGPPYITLIAQDLNGDGRPELIASGWFLSSTRFSVLINNGNGTFGAPVYYSGGAGGSLAVGNFFGDGRKHIAFLGGRNIVVYRNNGDGTLTAGPSMELLRERAGAITAADINNDGLSDLVTSLGGIGGQPVSLLINNGNGTFAEPLTLLNNQRTGVVVAADVDNDGDADFVVLQFNTFDLVVLLNSGGGTFAAPVSYPTGLVQVWSACALDVDGDGYLDIAALGLGDPIVGGTRGHVAVLRNNRDGTFAAPVDFLTGGQFSPGSIIHTDLDGDGRSDLVPSYYHQNPHQTIIQVLKNLTPQVINTLRIDRMLPDRGGNGTVTARIFGRSFQTGAQVKLTAAGRPDIAGSNTTLQNGNFITTRFDLTGADPGVRDVVVTNPDSTTAKLIGGLTIEASGAPQVWVDVIGRSVVLAGREQTYFLQYGNRGTVDAHQVRLWITFPTFLNWREVSGYRPSVFGRMSGSTFLAFDVPAIPPGITGTIPVRLTVPVEFRNQKFEIHAWEEEREPDDSLPPNIFSTDKLNGNIFDDSLDMFQLDHYSPPFQFIFAPPTNYTQDSAILPQGGDKCGSHTLCGRERLGECRGLEPDEAIAEDQNRLLFFLNDISINRPNACPTGVSFQAACRADCPCTSVRSFQASTKSGLIRFKNEYGFPVVISGGTECGHDPTLGHDTGYKVDLRADGSLSNFIMERFDPIKDSRGRDGYGISNGPVFVLESDPIHWDILFPDFSEATLNLRLEGNGSGRVTSDLLDIDCGNTCSQVFTKGIKVILSANVDSESRFDGWVGATNEFGLRFDRAAVRVDTDKTVVAKFVERPDDDDRPPDDPDCYKWDPTAGMGRGGWIWDCEGSAKRGRPPKPIDGLCWVWDDTAGPMHRGGWVLQRCNPPPADSAGLSVTGVAAYDPNDKVGSQGVGAGRYLSGEESLRYVIYFENIATASAPAHEVVISDQLDITKLDLDTFSLGHIAFADKLITPPPSLSQFTQDVDLRPVRNVIVRINASLDKTTGLLTWRFTSIDPDTGLPPEDPFAGFLPPNKNPPEGEGHVLFTVMPKQGLNTGVEIRNQARILFDANPPIDTPQWLNTIDNTKPSSRVLLLEGTQSSTTFNVQWSGTDIGSGVRGYTVYASENGGPFTVWLPQTSATQATFTGVDTHTYSFFSVARDLTGNAESIKSTPDTTTRVVLNRPPVAKTKNIEVAASDSCTVIIGPGDVDDGSFDPDGDAVGLALAPAGPLGLGVHEVVLTATDGHGASNSASATVTVVDQVPPTITNVSANPSVIWPPDRRMVDILVSYDAADTCGQTFSRLSVHSDEQLTPSDIEIVDAHHLRLRAERRGNGGGRTYRITIFVMDGYGNSSSKDVLIRVPNDQRR